MKVTDEDLKEMLGVQGCLDSFRLLDVLDLEYDQIQEGYNTEILNCIKRIMSDTQVAGTPGRTKVWENGWNENYTEFAKQLDINCLRPRYFHGGFPVRYQQKLVRPRNSGFEAGIDQLVKRCLFEMYAEPYGCVYEFGCGTGYNLALLGDMYPDKALYGFDLTNSAVKILELLRDKMGYQITGGLFDFISPDKNIGIAEDSVVFTFAALEQIGDRPQPFINYLVEKKPCKVVHLEPIVELYDEDNLLDYLAKWFHTKRGYLSGLLPYLNSLESKSVVQVDKVKRLYIGNRNHEGYTLVVWHPCVAGMQEEMG